MSESDLNEKLVNRAIDEQDMLSYFAYAFIDEFLMFEKVDSDFNIYYSEYAKFLQNNTRILENLSMNNLVYALASSNNEFSKKIVELIMDKIKSGEHFFSGTNAEFQFVGNPVNAWDAAFSRLGNDNIEVVKKSILSSLKDLKEKDPRAFNLANSFNRYSAIDSFICNYEKGIITEEKMDFLERLSKKNPNILNNMSYALLTDEIFEMGEEFVTRIARYPNMTAKLVRLLETNPKVFETIKNGFLELEKNGKNPETLEIERLSLTYALKNYKLLHEQSFEDIANLALTKRKPITFAIDDNFFTIDTSQMAITPLDAVHREYDIIREFAKSHTEALNITADNARNSDDVRFIDVDGKKVKQINLHGKFDLLVHSSDSGFKEEKKIIDGDFKKTWEQKKDVSAHLISCCRMNQDFFGHVPTGKNGILAVFSDVRPDDIGVMGPTDINSHIRSYYTKAGNPVYMHSNSLVYNARRVYAEISVEERLPDFILVFDDTPEDILKNSYKAASDFDIPVLSVDKKEFEEKQLERLDQMINLFRDTKDLEILKKLISTYETNVAGWLLNRKKNGEDDSLTSDINNERFRKDFDERAKKIYNLLQDYIKKCAENPKLKENLANVVKIMQAEIDIYEYANNGNIPISQTATSIDYQSIIDKANSLLSERVEIASNVQPKPIDISSIAENAVSRENMSLKYIKSVVATKLKGLINKKINNSNGEGGR